MNVSFFARVHLPKYQELPLTLSLLIFFFFFTSFPSIAEQTEGTIPNVDAPPQSVGKIFSPQMSNRHHNQPIVFNGYAILAGNAVHEVWDISNPYSPQRKAVLESSYRFGEAESHQVSLSRDANGRYFLATVSGLGLDIWDITDTTNPSYVKAVVIPGINYGDVDNGVWGISWQGNYIYLGATNNGLIVVDVSDKNNPEIVKRVSLGELGGVKAGPVFALGSILVVTTPKNNSGIVTVDISNPIEPVVLDIEKPSQGTSSYIGGFYGRNAVLISPLRFYDVTTDPSNIRLISTTHTPSAEYVSFDDNKLFLGGLRGGSEGIHIYDLNNLNNINKLSYIKGRNVGFDDQFSCPIGNMVLMSDDQNFQGHYVGSVIAYHKRERDLTPPQVLYTNPAAGETDVPVTTSIGISFSDWIEFKSVDPNSFIVREVGGQEIVGTWGWLYTTLTFTPLQPFDSNRTYEVVLKKDLIYDLVHNGLENDYTFRFTTSNVNSGPFEDPIVSGHQPVRKGQNVLWKVENPFEGVIYEWSQSDEVLGRGTEITVDTPNIGRFGSCVKAFQELPNGEGNTLKFEAEEASLGGGVQFESGHAGYSGAGYADYPGATGADVKLTWTINRPQAHRTTLKIRYANGGDFTRSLNIVVNGNSLGQQINFSPTGTWADWSIASLEVDLNSGDNSIALLADAGTVGPNIDFLSIDSQNSQVEIDRLVEAESAIASGGPTTANNHAGYTGSGYIDYPAETGDNVSITWVINSEEAHRTPLSFRYANGGQATRSLSLTVNNGQAMRMDFDPTNAWDSWQTVSAGEVQLEKGSNRIVLTANAGTQGPNIDSLTVSILAFEKLLANKCFIQTVFDQTPTPPKSSQTIINHNNRIWNVNPDSNTVTKTDGIQLKKLVEIPVGEAPKALTVVKDEIWVVNRDSWSISIINLVEDRVTATLNLPYASRPNSIIASHDDRFVYVGLSATGQLIKISSTDRQVIATLALGSGIPEHSPRLGAMALDATGDRLLINRLITKGNQGEVYIVDPSSMALVGTIPLVTSPVEDSTVNSRGIPNYLKGIAIHPSGGEAWIASKKDNVERGQFRDGKLLDHETTVRANVSRIKLSTNTELIDQRIDIDDGERANAVNFTAIGEFAFITVPGNNKVAIFDAVSGSKITDIPTGLVPDGSLYLDEYKRLFVHNFLSRTLSVFDISKIVDEVSAMVEPLAEIPLVSGELLSAEVLKGKRFFYSAAKRFNQNGYMSCASCHLDGSHDGRVWDFTSLGEGFRNTIDLRGRSGTGHGPLHWTANFDEVHDFENQIRILGGGTGLMNDSDYNTVKDPLGNPKAGLSSDLDALSAYVSSLTKVPPSPYKNSDGSFTNEAVQGETLFRQIGCANCHSGSTFTDSPQRKLHDVGTLKISSGTRIGGTLTGLDTPTVKGIWSTPPYLHDGSAETIEAAIEAHTNVTVNARDLALLGTYLRQLDDE